MLSIKSVKRAICAALLLAVLAVTVLGTTACSVDLDSVIDGLLGGDESGTVSIPERGESFDSESSSEIPYTAADFFVTEPYENGVKITGYVGTTPYIRVPETLGGAPVLAVGSSAIGDREVSDTLPALEVLSVELPDTVLLIENGAFADCRSIKSIKLPFVGGSADKNTNFGYIFGAKNVSGHLTAVPESLADVTVGGTAISDNAFNGCESLESVVLTEAVTLGNGVFKECASLKTVVIPSTVTDMGTGLFVGCKAIASITMPVISGVENGLLASEVFGGKSYEDNSSLMPSSLRSLTLYYSGDIPDYAFYGCDKLVSLTFVGDVSNVGNYAFYLCKRMKSLSVKGGEDYVGFGSVGEAAFAYCSAIGALGFRGDITVIPDRSFYSCSSLRTLRFGDGENVLPESIISIGDNAFTYCESLTRLTLPSSVTEIKDEMFKGCSYLSEISIPALVTRVGDNAFSGCSSLKTVSFEGNAVSEIGSSAFAYCTSLKELSLPDSVRSVGDYLFAHAWALDKVKLPASLVRISEGCFFGCTRLTAVSFDGSALSEIGKRAFSGCERIEQLTLSEKITAIGDFAFDECENLVVTVKSGSYAHTWLLTNGFGTGQMIIS
ncbi:MAG: leucine-rich repeat domain-containing protein [Clostridia bacterium]|nr:leucine-rich repeat domain-containing protein [Clostridia bacterium]